MNAFLSRLLARRSGRRAVAVLLWLSLAVIFAARITALPPAVFGITTLFTCVCYFALLRVLQLQRGAGERPLDEREQAVRDRGHFVAFRIANFGMLLVVMYGMLAEQLGMWMPSTPRQAVGAMTAIALAFGLLPATVLAWTVEDEPLDDEDAPAVPLLTRTPLPAARRWVMFGMAACAAAAGALGWAGVVPALAARASLLLGLATGMLFAAIVMTRSRNGSAV
jgi:hypothetical protein